MMLNIDLLKHKKNVLNFIKFPINAKNFIMNLNRIIVYSSEIFLIISSFYRFNNIKIYLIVYLVLLLHSRIIINLASKLVNISLLKTKNSYQFFMMILIKIPLN